MHPGVFLALFCGLLAKNVQGETNPHATISLSPQMLQHIISARMDRQEIISRLQSLPIQEAMKNGIKESGGVGFMSVIPFFGDVIKNIYSDVTGMKITSADVQKPNFHFDTTGKRIFVNCPWEMVLEVKLPLIWGSVCRDKVSGVMKAEAWITEDEDGDQKLTLGNCQSSPNDIRMTPVDGKNSIFKAVNDLRQIMGKVIKERMPALLNNQLCQTLKGGMSRMMDFLQGSPFSQIQGKTFIYHPYRFFLYQNQMEIEYKVLMQQADGGNYMLPPVSARLPQIGLTSEYVMNLLMSSPVCDAVMQVMLGPGVMKIDSEEEVENFQRQMESIPGYSMPANTKITSLHISHGTPMLSMKPASIQAYQDMEIKIYGTRPRPPNKHFATIKMKVIYDVSTLIQDLSMTFSLEPQRLTGVSLTRSSIGVFDPLPMRPAILQLLSNTYVSYANIVLAAGFPLPMMKELGVKKVDVASGEGVLLLMA